MVELKNIIVLLIVLLNVCHNSPSHKIMHLIEKMPIKEMFKAWHYVNQKDKEYDINTPLAIRKYKTFKKNLKFINEYNEKNGKTIGIGPFADLTNKEFKASYLGSSKPQDFDLNGSKLNGIPSQEFFKTEKVNEYSESINWSSYYTKVLNQNPCGSCYSFAATGVAEVFAVLKGKEFKFLSNQQIIDCNKHTRGCNGGWPTSVYKYLEEIGVAEESYYAYTGSNMLKCKLRDCTTYEYKPYLFLKGFHYCSKYNADNSPCADEYYEKAITRGPITVTIDAGSVILQHLANEDVIISPIELKCKEINHGLILVQMTKDYVLLRNSWGRKWGNEGYFKIRREKSNELSACGVLNAMWQPIAITFTK